MAECRETSKLKQQNKAEAKSGPRKKFLVFFSFDKKVVEALKVCKQ
jgi:hypothetical protein